MGRNVTIIIVMLTMLVRCHAPKTELPTQSVDLPAQTPSRAAESNFPIRDGGLITGLPCASPCFFGVRVGETPLKQVVSSLNHNGISPCYAPSDTTIFCGNRIAISADPSTFIVDGIQYDPTLRITVAEIIRKYGNPNFVSIMSDSISEAPKISAFLLWDSIKMRIDFPDMVDEGQGYTIENATEPQWIIFLDETSYSKLTTSEFAHPWQGYGTYRP